MADLAHPWRLRVAFAFGDEGLAAHVCEAVGSEAELVYTAPMAEFDMARLASDHVDAVLVNVDAGTAMDTLDARVGEGSVRVVFNDPEISVALEGWARARWLRHLMAKLRGDADVDPPRPVTGGVAPAVATAPVSPASAAMVDAGADAQAGASAMAADAQPVVDVAAPVAVEAESVAAPAEVPVAAESTAAAPDPQPAPEPVPVSAGDLGLDETPLVQDGMRSADSDAVVGATLPGGADLGGLPVDGPLDEGVPLPEAGIDDPLDVDTEALSAMIDARLAEPDAAPVTDDLEATWAIPPPAEPEGSAPVEANAGHAESVATMTAPAAGGDAQTPPQVVVSGDDADGDILASLPSLDEWTLVDPGTESPATHAGHSGPATAPAVPDGLGAGLELLPLDGVAPPVDKEHLIKRWLDESETKRHADGGKA